MFGRSTFDMLVNNAGAGHYGSAEATTEAQFDIMVAEHLKDAMGWMNGVRVELSGGQHL